MPNRLATADKANTAPTESPCPQVIANAAKIRQIALVLECQPNGFNLLVGTAGEVGDGAMSRPAVVPVGFADEVGCVRFSVDDFVNGAEPHDVRFICDRINKSVVIPYIHQYIRVCK